MAWEIEYTDEFEKWWDGYEEFIPFADRIYEQHLKTLRKERLIDDQEVR